MRNGLFDVNVLACLGRQNGDQRMRVIGGRDRNGVDVFAIEDLAKVLFRVGVPKTFRASGQYLLVAIAQRDDVVLETPDVRAAAAL